MKTLMHDAPGYGASPEATREYDFDAHEAGQMLAAMNDIRTAAGDFAVLAASRLGDHDLWDCSLARQRGEQKLARFKLALDELIDDFVDQNKLAEAGEIA